VNDVIADTLVRVFPIIVPEMVLGLAACALFVGGTFRSDRGLWAAVALVSLAAAGVALAWTVPATLVGKTPNYASPLVPDELALLIRVMALVGGGVLVLVSWDELPDDQAADYHGCLLIAVAGLSLTGLANDLVTLFLALEMISIPTYILLYLPRRDPTAQEAAMKYFLLSVFASALLLFGFSYWYGLTGTTNLPGLLDALKAEDGATLPAIALLALVLIVAGFGFKITAVPFHFYAPDVYQGAPTGAVALLAFVPKVAGFVALVRLLDLVGIAGRVGSLGHQVPILFWILAAVTMSLGNVLALLQHNLKRLLAYSSVAHAGYMLIGLAAAQPLAASRGGEAVPGGAEAVLFYLAAYGAMTVGAFAVLVYLSTPERPIEMEDDLAGLSQSHPGIALILALFLFSLIGIPLTGGFVGKLLLFLGAMAVEGDNARLFRWLAFLGVLNAAVGAWYYLRILSKIYLHTSIKPVARPRPGPGLAALWVCALVTLLLGIYPRQFLQVASRAAQAAPTAAPVVASER
jgi:NADH-quinone oxidoreductase subunit N